MARVHVVDCAPLLVTNYSRIIARGSGTFSALVPCATAQKGRNCIIAGRVSGTPKKVAS